MNEQVTTNMVVNQERKELVIEKRTPELSKELKERGLRYYSDLEACMSYDLQIKRSVYLRKELRKLAKDYRSYGFTKEELDPIMKELGAEGKFETIVSPRQLN